MKSEKNENTPIGFGYMRCGTSQTYVPYAAFDKLIVILAVKVMKSPQLRQGLFDLHCWHISTQLVIKVRFSPKSHS